MERNDVAVGILPAKSPTAASVSDSILLRRLKTGNEDAATQIYLRYAKRLQAFARTKATAQLARSLDAEDIVQSVFRSFFKGARQGMYDVPPGEDLWKLLLVIALNKIRKKVAFEQAAKRDVRLTEGLNEAHACEQATARAEPACAFLGIVVREALERLTPHHREMVGLRIEGYEVAEIAARTGRSKRTVERSLQEARTRLSSLLNEE